MSASRVRPMIMISFVGVISRPMSRPAITTILKRDIGPAISPRVTTSAGSLPAYLPHVPQHASSPISSS
jgi:hypothetical protein